MPFSPKLLNPSNARPAGLSRQHVIRLGSMDFQPHLSGGLYWSDERTLIVSDLHLETGTSLARRGVHVPPFDTVATLGELRKLLDETRARRLLLLGDSFHSADAHQSIDGEAMAQLQAITGHVETVWVTGNHDPHPPQGLGGTCVDVLALGEVIFRHIPAAIPAGCCEIAGHLHPGASVVQRGHRNHGKCFVNDHRRLIMPAFGAYTGALSVASRAFDGLFDEPLAMVHVLGRSALHRLPLTRVR